MRIGIVLSLLALSLGSPLAFGQGSSNPVDIGLQEYHEYHGGDIDHVNLDNGNLTLNIPLVSYPQRGNALKLDLGIVYNGSGLSYQEVCPPGPVGCTDGWLNTTRDSSGLALTPNATSLGSFSPALFDLQQIAQSEVILAIPDTSPQASYVEHFWDTSDGGSHQAGQTSTGQIALDGSGFQAGWTEAAGPEPTYTCTWDCTLPTILNTPTLDGATLEATNNGITYYDALYGQVRIDADGNYIGNLGSGYTDTAGRVITFPSVNSSPSSSQTAPCTASSLPSLQVTAISEIATWTPSGFTQPFTFCYAEFPVSTGIHLATGANTVSNTTELMLERVVLPNGQAWTFSYNESLSNCNPVDLTTNIGDLTQITLPTGGTIAYTYGCITPLGATVPTQTTAVTSRTVNDGTGAHTWTYSFGSSSSGPVTTVTDPLLNQTTYAFDEGSPTESRVNSVYSGSVSSGTLLRTTTWVYPTSYATRTGYPLWPTTETTTLENGQSTETAYQYCCSISFASILSPDGPYPSAAINGKVTDAKIYDYTTGTLGTLLKETATSYLFQSNSNYIHPGFFDLLSSQTVYNGSGTEMAQTTYSYDQWARVASGFASISGSQLTTPLYTVYGHETTKTDWLNTGPSNPATTFSYYDTGESYRTTDPGGHTTINYFCSDTAPASTPCSSSPYMGSSLTAVVNAKSQQTTFAYRSDTGQTLTVKDPNGKTTTYSYLNPSSGVNDYLNRLTSISYPDGGSTSIQYNDTDSMGATITEKITSTLNKQTQAIVDPLGRISQTILLSDPSGWTYTLNTYDVLGRKYQVWNPTRCQPITTNCGENTYGVTTYNYDALGREILEIPPDGTATSDNISTSYSGNTATVTDEAGKYRTTTNDALGRLRQISEGLSNFITIYTYDALNNLTCAEQHGGVSGTGCSSPSSDDPTSPWRVRRFTYDSLSRLITAKNPETGTITYGYNSDSVLTSKTDNRGITITYTPDVLHRITSKSYSDSEPTVSYTYDAFASGSNYGIGRRTGMTDASGSTAWTYDTMGRIWTESQTIGTVNNSTGNTYNLDGSVATTTYPSGSVISVTPGGDGRPLAVTDTTNGIDYAQSLAYAPPGLLGLAVYGYSSTYAGITQVNTYNSRGQPKQLRACGLTSCTDSGGTYLIDLSYNYGLGTNDNGNVLGISNNNQTSRSQDFSYDSMNRIYTAKSGTAWGVSLTTSTGTPGIDPWGNVFQTSAVGGTSINPMGMTQVIGNNNQFTVGGYTYDAAGNVLTDGINTGCGSVGYAWNAEEQMTCAAGSSYTYDGDGIRVEKAGGDATPTLYWGGLAESDLSGNFTSEYIFASGRRIARRNVATGSVYYYFADMLGSTSTVATAAGAVENESDYYPFGGEDIVTQNLTNQHYKFTGKERDTESGNDYFGARYYASSMGRFLSPDPVGNWAASPDDPQSWNQYAYVEGNPLTMVDPDGTCPVIIAGIGMSPDSASGKDLVATAGLYGADVDFDYAGQSKLMSIANLALSGLGANGAATQSASGAMSAALADANAGGTSFFALAFSGGAQASISAGVGTGSMNPTAFYDPGTHLFQGLPAGSSEYTGSGFTSDLVRGVSGHLGGTNVPGCGHNVNCAIQRSAALQAALKNAGPCSNPQVFTRNLHYTYIPPIPMQLFPLTFYWPIPEDDESNGSGNATILPGFTPVEE